MNKEYEALLEVLKVYINNEKDIALIDNAYKYAKKAYDIKTLGIVCEVASVVGSLKLSPTTVASTFFLGVNNPKLIDFEKLEEEYGDDVCEQVRAIVNINKIPTLIEGELDSENFRKLFIAMAKDVRVIIIKICERLIQARHLSSVSEEEQKKFSQMTLDVFSPLAHRLGFFKIKSELENTSLYYLDREGYAEIVDELEASQKQREDSVNKIINSIHELLGKYGMKFRIYGRAKEIYSIYKKIKYKAKNFNELYDLLALRVITDTEVQCYEVLGYIHANYKPVPGRFKDYIAMPKANMYQALHTTIISDDGYVCEVQIKTKEMEEVAETGIAAHWTYKESQSGSNKKLQEEIEDKLHWFRDFVSLNEDNADESTKEYIDNLKKDIFEANVYVLSPKGRVIELVSGSTPIDFAYKVHSAVGDSAVGAVVNGHLVPLNTELKTGDVVEIKTSKVHAYPSEGWLDFVKTATAKNRIRKALMKKDLIENRDELVDNGRNLIVEELKNLNINNKIGLKIIEDEKFYEHFSLHSFEDLCISISNKMISPITIAGKVKSKLDEEKKKNDYSNFKNKKVVSKNRYGVIVHGAEDLLVTLSQCCCPIPGDDIVGYVSKGKGIKIHRKECPTISSEIKRLVEAAWTEAAYTEQLHPVDLMLECTDRSNLLADIMNILTQHKIQVLEIHASRNNQTLTTSISMAILVKDANHLLDVMNVVRNISSVYEVKRISRN